MDAIIDAGGDRGRRAGVEGSGVKHCEVQVFRGGAGGQGPTRRNGNEQQQWTKNLRAWEEPSAHGGERDLKK